MRELHRLTLQVSPECKLWFFDGKEGKNHTVSNPTIGYGFHKITYADGKSREFFRIGVSGNRTGISVYILGLKDKKYLAKTYEKKLGKASVTGYCIRFKALKDINIDTLEAAIRDGLAAQNEKKQPDKIIPLLKASSYRCKGPPSYDPYSPDPRHKAILYKTGLPQ